MSTHEQEEKLKKKDGADVNCYNPIIQFCTRSNIDIRVLLRDSDAQGCLQYIFSYATQKTESTVDGAIEHLGSVQ